MFDSVTGSKAKRSQDYQRLVDENDLLQKRNEQLLLQVSQMQQRINELEKNDTSISEDDNREIVISPILLKYIEVTNENMTKMPRGRRYDGLHEYFSLLSLMGPHYFDMLTTNMMFPTYKTATKYTKKLLDDFGIDESIFNGTVDNIVKIMQMFLPQDFQGKGVIMVDAAYVTPYVRINKDGKVDGLLNITQIDPDLAEYYINDDDAFLDFIKINIKAVISAEFGLTFAPLNPQINPFPIACLPSNSGKATPELVTIIESIISELPKNISIIGLGTDGDNAYNFYSNIFIDNIINDFKNFIELNAVEIIEKYATLLHFSDPYHLSKRDRYRKVSRENFIVSPADINQVKSYKDLIALEIPHYLFDDNKGRKMEDDLPLKIFNLQTIQKIIKKEDFHLLLAMLPTTLLLESLHRESLNKQATIDYLLLGSSVMIVFFLMQHIVVENQFDVYKQNQFSYKKMRCFTNSWSKHYIFTTLCIASQIITEKSINTGACSSHYQEHSFANIRRHSKGDHSHMKFIKSMKHILLEHILIDKMNIEINVPKSRSDSGKKIFDETHVEVRPIKYYLQLAKQLWRNVTDFRRFHILSPINEFRKKMTVDDLIEFLGIFSEKNRSSISTKSTGMVKTAGLNNMIFWNADDQLYNLVDEEE